MKKRFGKNKVMNKLSVWEFVIMLFVIGVAAFALSIIFDSNSNKSITGNVMAFPVLTNNIDPSSISVNEVTSHSGVLPKVGKYFMVYSGKYSSPQSADTNDYAYTQISSTNYDTSSIAGEPAIPSYIFTTIRKGDKLSFWTYAFGNSPGCGIELEIVDSKGVISNLRWNHPDQDNVQSVVNNPQSKGKWYKRNIDLSDLEGKKITRMFLVQQMGRNAGATFKCGFDGIQIINPVALRKEATVVEDQCTADYCVGTCKRAFKKITTSGSYVAPTSCGYGYLFINATKASCVKNFFGGCQYTKVCVSRDSSGKCISNRNLPLSYWNLNCEEYKSIGPYVESLLTSVKCDEDLNWENGILISKKNAFEKIDIVDLDSVLSNPHPAYCYNKDAKIGVNTTGEMLRYYCGTISIDSCPSQFGCYSSTGSILSTAKYLCRVCRDKPQGIGDKVDSVLTTDGKKAFIYAQNRTWGLF